MRKAQKAHKEHSGVDMLELIGGLAMMVCGLYWFLSSVTVTSGFYGMRFGSFSVGSGLVVVPMIIGIIMLFFNFRSLFARLLTGAGFLIIIASVIMNTRLYFRPVSLYAYILMLVLAAGGAALVMKALWNGR